MIASWLLSAPICIATRELIGKPTRADGEYSNPHWITAEVIGRTVGSVLAFLWIGAVPLAGLLIGLVTGLVASVGVVLLDQPWKPPPQPIHRRDDPDEERSNRRGRRPEHPTCQARLPNVRGAVKADLAQHRTQTPTTPFDCRLNEISSAASQRRLPMATCSSSGVLVPRQVRLSAAMTEPVASLIGAANPLIASWNSWRSSAYPTFSYCLRSRENWTALVRVCEVSLLNSCSESHSLRAAGGVRRPGPCRAR